MCDEGLWNGGPTAVRAYASSDGGTTFHQLGPPLALPCCATVVASGPAGTSVAGGNTDRGATTLLATFDQGAKWTSVYQGQSALSWSDLAFTSRSQGVAVEASSSTGVGALLMTSDGGRSWNAVNF